MSKQLKVINYLNNQKQEYKCNYIMKNNILRYTLNKELISINLKDFKFIKKNKESTFTLTNKEGILELKENNLTFDLPINYINFSFVNNKSVILEYLLESNEEMVRIEIEIEE